MSDPTTKMKTELQSAVERLFALGAEAKQDRDARRVFIEFRDALTQGKVRAAEKRDGRWQTNVWVKQGILLGFRLGELADMTGNSTLSFVDKDTFPARGFKVADGVRVVAGGSSARLGAYVAPGVVCMPPMYINVGATSTKGPWSIRTRWSAPAPQVGKRECLNLGGSPSVSI